MIVTVKPPDREEYALSLDGQPRYSSAILGGYELAEIPCQLEDEQRESSMGARLRIHGESGIVWQGIVMRRPGRGEPLVAQGWGVCATYGRREVLYADTRIMPWKTREDETTFNEAWTLKTTTTALKVVCGQGVEVGGDSGYWREVPTTTFTRITFDWGRYSNTKELRVYYGTTTDGTEPSSWTLASTTVPYGSGSNTGSSTVDITSSHNALLLWVGSNTSGAAASTYTWGRWSNIHVYGASGVTSTTTHNVFDDIVLREIVGQKWSTTDYFMGSGAEYYAWIDAQATAVVPLVFESCDALTKFSELTKYAAYHYGWYSEMVAGAPAVVPHWTAISTTPDYIINLPEADAYDIDESALDELISAVRVHYSRKDGSPAYKDVTDTDITHPLVRMGVTRYGDVVCETSSSATASAIGETALTEQGRSQTKGAVTTRYVYTTAGAPVYLPDIRPGKMVRLYGLEQGQADCVIRRVNLVGDQVVNIELDNDPYRLDILLAKTAKRAEARR